MDVVSAKIKSVRGDIEIPSDKSITHRAFLFSALTKGECKISNFSFGKDCMSTLEIIKQLGCKIKHINEKQLVINAENAVKKSDYPLNCGNSGTTTRLIMGILASMNFSSSLFGDESLSKRPMKRVITPLEQMGAEFLHNNYTLPVTVKGRILHSIDYVSNLASAQVKSCILLAGLNTDGVTSFSEPYKSRNHTELMFKYMGADISVNGNKVSIKKSQLNPADISVCGDISSAAFFITAALIVPDSDLIIRNVGINETRDGIISVYKQMGADIELFNIRVVSNEKVADIRVKYSKLKGTVIQGEIIPKLIDEIPVIAVAASLAEGQTVIKDANDLRNKETDRITAVKTELCKLGADIEETEDGLIIEGTPFLNGNTECECYHDHRIAMSEFVAGLVCKHPVKIKEFEWVNISFPEFLELFEKIKVN